MSLSAIAQRTVVVKASAESRRAVLSGFLAGAALTIAGAANAEATPVVIYDDRKAIAKGYNNIYEARDSTLSENTRQGRDQVRADIASTKARAKAAEARIDNTLGPYVEKNYWTEARNELRRAVGDLRLDLNTLASAKPKEEKKKALELRKDFINKIEAFDLSLRQKNEKAATANLAIAQSALDTVLAAVL